MLDSIQVQGHWGGPGLRPLEGPRSPFQGLLEALDGPDPGSEDPDPGLPDPRIRAGRAPDPGHPGQPSWPGSSNPGQFCQKCRLAPPGSQLPAGMAGKWLFPAWPETGQPGSSTARAELKPSLSSILGMLESWDSGGKQSI